MQTTNNTIFSQIVFALRLLKRDWRSGAISILILSLAISVATVTSISLFSSRIHNSILDEAREFLAGDIKISGSLPIKSAWLESAKQLNLASSEEIVFNSMAFSDSDALLAQVKAVSESYPLKGNLEIEGADNQITDVTSGPRKNEIWVAPRLATILEIRVGDTLYVGDASFTVSAILINEPDASQNSFAVAPRIMMHTDDVPTTNVVQVGSRIRYSQVFAGNPAEIETFHTLIQDDLAPHYTWLDVKTQNQSVGAALKRSETFLLLAGSLSVVLGCAAIALAARRYANKQNHVVAVLKTLGTTPHQISVIYISLLIMLSIIGISIGLFAGFALHWGILIAVKDLFDQQIASASTGAYFAGLFTGLVALWSFAGPPLFFLRSVAPAAALNRNNTRKISAGLSAAIGYLAVILIVFFYSRSVMLTLYQVVGITSIVIGAWAVSLGLLHFINRLAKRAPANFRLGLTNLYRHRYSNGTQVAIFSIIFLLVAILVSSRTHLINQWQNQIPNGAANHFVFNIFPDEIEDIKHHLSEAEINFNPFYPMTRGRVTYINTDSVEDRAAEFGENNDIYEREINLTSADYLGSDNEVIQGEMWTTLSNFDPEKPLLISVEEGYAEGLNIQLHDEIIFSLAGEQVKAKVANIRTVKWDSMNPNFFIIFNQNLDEYFGANWLTSFYAPASKRSVINDLVKRYPTVSLIDLDQTINQIRNIIKRISQAVEFILLLVTSTGLLVLAIGILSTLDMRKKESAILRTLGAQKSLVRMTLTVEFAGLGFLAGVLAVVGTELALFLMQKNVFDLDYHPFYVLWFLIPATSTTLITLFGLFATREVISTPPLRVLRNQS